MRTLNSIDVVNVSGGQSEDLSEATVAGGVVGLLAGAGFSAFSSTNPFLSALCGMITGGFLGYCYDNYKVVSEDSSDEHFSLDINI